MGKDLKSQLKQIKQAMAGEGTEKTKSPSIAPKSPPPGPVRVSKHPTATTSTRVDSPPGKSKSPTAGKGSASTIGTIRAAVCERPPLLPALPKPSVLTRQAEFHKPAAWLAHGRRSQLTEKPTGRAKEIFIGLDFGTAYTKAAVGLLDKVFPVDWRGVLNLRSRYLLPSEYSVLAGGGSHLGQHPKATADDLVAELKQPFIASKASEIHICQAAVYIALVLQYIRAWVYEHHGLKLGTNPLRWHLNVGTPSNGFEEDERTRAYRRLMWTAWSLSLRGRGEINYARASIELGQVTSKLPLDLVEMDPVPEFVGQLAGYTQSAQRQDGLHMLVDVGGGTVDMVTFNVHHADGDDVFPFFVPRVEALGTYGMLANRFGGIATHDFKLKQDLDDLVGAKEFSVAIGVPVGAVRARDVAFSKTIATELAAVLHETRQRRYRLAPEWRHGIRTFVTGGGASLPVYQDAVEQCRTPGNCALLRSPLPVHPKLDGYAGPIDEYHRISVACGLATNRLSLGRIVPATQVEDDRPMVDQLKQRDRLSHEELYSR